MTPRARCQRRRITELPGTGDIATRRHQGRVPMGRQRGGGPRIEAGAIGTGCRLLWLGPPDCLFSHDSRHERCRRDRYPAGELQRRRRRANRHRRAGRQWQACDARVELHVVLVQGRHVRRPERRPPVRRAVLLLQLQEHQLGPDTPADRGGLVVLAYADPCRDGGDDLAIHASCMARHRSSAAALLSSTTTVS